MIRALALLFALFAAPVATAPVTVEVARKGDGFVATYELPKSAPAWAFFRSQPDRAEEKPWRPRSWRVLTPGVRLEHRGNYDLLVPAAGRKAVPRRVRIALTPFTGDLVKDYVPAMRIGDGIALFDGHFALFAPKSVDQAAKLPLDLDGQDIDDPGTRVTFRGLGDAEIVGDVKGLRAGDSGGAYGLFDVPKAAVTDGVATIVDPDLPAWLRDRIVAQTPRTIATLTDRLGPSALSQAAVMMSFENPDDPGLSMNGGTLDGLIMMRFSGERLAAPVPNLLPRVNWFIAHEASHFWLGQTVRAERLADSWIAEGGADLLAIRTSKALDPAYDEGAVIREEVADCASRADKPVAGAGERGDHRAFYACGAVFALIAERYSNGDFYAFTRRLIADSKDGRTDKAAWLRALADAGAPATVVARIDTLIERGAPDGKAAVEALLREAGITVPGA